MNSFIKWRNYLLFWLSAFGLFLYTGCKQKIIDSNPPPEYILENIIDLPLILHESSGLLIYDSLFWSFNDGGNSAEIYGISPSSGDILKILILKDTRQNDWEDITMDSSFIYIGDFGNNYGSRENLSVLKIAKTQINSLPEQEITATKIYFSFPDQIDFSPNYRNTSFDCEAMACMDDSILLFTKDWLNYTCSVYKIPKIHGNYKAVKSGTFNSEGLVAGADYNEKTNQLFITGYADYLPMVIVFNNFQCNNIGELNFEKFIFDDYSGVKLEGIATKDGQIYVSSEGSVYQQAIYKVIQK